MRGLPFMMNSLMTSSFPPSESLDRTGPYCALVSCGLVWQTRQYWLNNRMPRSCLSLSAGWPTAGCADAPRNHAVYRNSNIATQRFISLVSIRWLLAGAALYPFWGCQNVLFSLWWQVGLSKCDRHGGCSEIPLR